MDRKCAQQHRDQGKRRGTNTHSSKQQHTAANFNDCDWVSGPARETNLLKKGTTPGSVNTSTLSSPCAMNIAPRAMRKTNAA
jgi:hypothetical protein